jgi:Icc protein
MSNISRRNFLKTALAVSATPLMATTEKKQEQTLKFIHVTDSHLDLSDDNSIEALELMVDFINSDYKDLDLVLFGGDNFNNNVLKDSDAVKFKEIVDGLHCPYYTVRGNKEAYPIFDKHITLDEFKNMFYTSKALAVQGRDWLLAVKGYNILGLDSCIEGKNNGLYRQETLSFAQKVLKEGKPTIILNHHPYTNFWGETKKSLIFNYVLNNTDEVQEKLFKYDNLILTLSGHKHVDSVKEIQGTKVIATRGFIRPLDLDMYPMRYVALNGNNIMEKLIYTS